MGDFRLAVATGILITGVTDDLLTRKVHNHVALISALIALISSFIFSGVNGVYLGLTGLGTAAVLLMPLYILKVLGGGDVKIAMAMGLSSEWSAMAETIILSVFFGALLGLLRSLMQKQGWETIKNTLQVLSRSHRPSTQTLHTIPYTVALLFGWMSHLVLNYYGRSLL